MSYEPDKETLKELVILVYLRYLMGKFVWKDIKHTPPMYELIYGYEDGTEKNLTIDKEWLDGSVLGITFSHIISVDSVEVK